MSEVVSRPEVGRVEGYVAGVDAIEAQERVEQSRIGVRVVRNRASAVGDRAQQIQLGALAANFADLDQEDGTLIEDVVFARDAKPGGIECQTGQELGLDSRFVPLAENGLDAAGRLDEEDAASGRRERLAVVVVERQRFVGPGLIHQPAAGRRAIEDLLRSGVESVDCAVEREIERVEPHAADGFDGGRDVDQVLHVPADALLPERY